MNAVLDDKDWNLYWRIEKRKAKEENRNPKLVKLTSQGSWNEIAFAAWSSADPGIHFIT
jgi:ribonucleoside-diphosphate reductase alpha chain